MFYGNTMEPWEELVEAATSCPFQLVYSDQVWNLYKKLIIPVNGKKIIFPFSVAKFSSIGELFLHIFQSDEWYCTLSSAAREALVECIKFVFFTQDGTKQNYEARYQYYMQFHPQWPINWSEVVLPFMLDLDEIANSRDLPYPSNASEALLFSEGVKYSPPKSSPKEFDTCDDLAWWAFKNYIEQNKQMAVCKNCGCYFIKGANHRKYCSNNCRDAAPQVGRFAGEEAIARKYGAIYERFRRKKGSGSSYVYNEISFDGRYNALELFSDLANKKMKKKPQEFVFYAEHFEQIEKTYKRLYDSKYEKVKKAKKAFLNEEISEKKYKEVLDPFLVWLKNVIKQLDAFSLNK